MIISRKSPFTGNTYQWDIDISQKQLNNYNSGMYLHIVAPQLTLDEREFIITGITPTEWKELFNETNSRTPVIG